MKNIKRKEEGVSPVIATILMVAITVVLAATLYMMLPSGSETEQTEAMSGRLANTGTDEDGDWYCIVTIDSGSVSFSGDKVHLYNKSSGISYSASDLTADGNDDVDINEDDGVDVTINYNDNDDNDNINGGDTFKITNDQHDTAFKNILEDNYQLRIEGTSLQVNLG